MFKSEFALSVLLITVAFNATAQKADSLLKPSPVKTLTASQYNALRNGDDFNNFGLVADLNGYPSAAKALMYGKEVKLSPAQAASLTTLNNGLQFKVKEMGAIIVRNERALDSLFRYNKLSDGVLIFYTNRYGIYQGELRNAILQAALKTRSLLTPTQLNKLAALKN
jgi:hypothetical protein